MSNKVDIKKAGFYYLIGTIFNRGIAFLAVPIFTRIMSVSDYGIINTYNSWVTILTIIISLALYMSIRSSFIDYKENTKDFLSVIVKFVLLFGLSISFIIVTLCWLFSVKTDIILIILCLIQSISSSIIEVVSMYFMMKYKYKARTLIMVLPNFIATLLSIFAIIYILNDKLYYGKIICSSIITMFFGLGVYIYSQKQSTVKYKKEYIKYGLKISIPLVFHGLALSVLAQSDRTMITLLRNSTETGIYGLIYNFSMIAAIITTAFDGIWIPFFTRMMNENNYDSINFYSSKYLKLITTGMICIMLFGPEVIKILAPSVYYDGIVIIPPLVLSNYLIFIYSFFVNVEHYYKKTVSISINTIVAALFNILLNIYFIIKFGYIGAAYSTLISYALSLLLHYRYSKTLNNELFPLAKIIFSLIIIVFSIAIFYLFLNNLAIRWIIAIIYTIIILYIERKDIFKILKK